MHRRQMEKTHKNVSWHLTDTKNNSNRKDKLENGQFSGITDHFWNF